MTREVFDNHGTAHAWASGRVTRARSNNGNFWSEGRALYSYGTHYLVAFDLGERGEADAIGRGNLAGAVLFNSDSSSMTTNGKHKPAARSAVSHKRVVYVDSLTMLRDPLEALAAGRPDTYGSQKRAVESWARSYVSDSKGRRHVLALAQTDLARDVFALFGVRGFAAFYQKTARDARAQAAAEAKREAARLAANARANGALSPQDVKDLLRDTSRGHGGRGAVESLGRSFLASLKFANAQARGFKKTAQALKGHRKTVSAFLANLDRLEARRGQRRALAANIARLRLALSPVDPDPAQDLENLIRGRGRGAYGTGLDSYAWHGGHAFGTSDHKAPTAAQEAAELRLLATAQAAQAIHESPACVPPSVRARLAALEAETAAPAREALETRIARAKAAAEAREAERLERERATREAWLAGDTSARFHGRDAQGGAYLRAVKVTRDESGEITGGDLQTSQGAVVPLTHALRVFRFLKHCRETGRAWNRNGRTIRVGFYQVDSVAPDGSFRAGCHAINWPQVEALAERLGVLDLAAQDVTELSRGAA